MSRYPDGSKPNHYAHDSFGCPYECDADCNHPEPCPERRIMSQHLDGSNDSWSDLDWAERGLVLLMAVGFGAVVAAVAIGLAFLIRLVF